MTISSQLTEINDVKSEMKTLLENRGHDMTGVTFDQYPAKMTTMPGGGTAWSQDFWQETQNKALASYPDEFLTMPEPASTENVVYALVQVLDTDSETVALYVTTTGGASYNIDWGDGTTTTGTSGVQQEHTYTYSDVDLDSTTVSAYGFKQAMIEITPSTGETFATVDFARIPSAVVSSTGYILPLLAVSAAGSNITSFKITNNASAYYPLNLRYFRLEENSITNFLYMFYQARSLTCIPKLYTNNMTTAQGMFIYCYSLTTIPEITARTNNINGYRDMFAYCYSLLTLPNIWVDDASDVYSGMGSASYLTSMFQNCYSLINLPPLDQCDTSGIISLNSTFEGCYSLTSSAYNDSGFDTSSVTEWYQTFYNNYALEQAPNWDYSSGTTYYQIFYNCYTLRDASFFGNTYNSTGTNINLSYAFGYTKSLERAPDMDTSNALTMTYMFYLSGVRAAALDCNSCTSLYYTFYGCTYLREVNLTNTHNVQSLYYTFYQNYSLQKVSWMDLSSCSSMYRAFAYCATLPTVPLFDMPTSAFNAYQMFYSNDGIRHLPALDFSYATTFTSFTQYCDNIRRSEITPPLLNGITHYYQNCEMSATALNEVFTNLPTVTSATTIIVSGNPGSATCNTTIATNKGWTVTT